MAKFTGTEVITHRELDAVMEPRAIEQAKASWRDRERAIGAVIQSELPDAVCDQWACVTRETWTLGCLLYRMQVEAIYKRDGHKYLAAWVRRYCGVYGAAEMAASLVAAVDMARASNDRLGLIVAHHPLYLPGPAPDDAGGE